MESLADTFKNEIYTIFAPTEEAFAGADLSDIDIDALTDILLYHTINDTIISAEDLGCGDVYTMTGGTQTTVHECNADSVFQVGGGNAVDEWPEIVDTDLGACNGIVHIVNKLILPS
mmetsp:Transcript_21464/g.51183  ORF Transcript_21464/g.51183 Transcript_21464/m.51183 type:complete len:117 (+) Transcript_21464:2422-2772(+)